MQQELHQTILAHNHNADLIKHHKALEGICFEILAPQRVCVCVSVCVCASACEHFYAASAGRAFVAASNSRDVFQQYTDEAARPCPSVPAIRDIQKQFLDVGARLIQCISMRSLSEPCPVRWLSCPFAAE